MSTFIKAFFGVSTLVCIYKNSQQKILKSSFRDCVALSAVAILFKKHV